jgi:uncharacterized membrane protein YuzA (DUF378 family)
LQQKENVVQKPLYWIALVLVVVGAVNWELVGVAQFDLVAALFGGSSAVLARIVYALVGVSGLILGAMHLAATSPAPGRYGAHSVVR